MGIRIGITGFGRIGRLAMRAMYEQEGFELAAINDIDPTAAGAVATTDYLAYQLKYDTVHGRFPHDVGYTDDSLIIDGKRVPCYSYRDATQVPWKDAGVDYLIDSTGAFTTLARAEAHLAAGVKKVVITSPSADAPMFVMGVNHDTYNDSMNIVSNASCTTNCLAPLAKVLNDKWGITSGLMTTVHAATSTQNVVDNKRATDWRGGRAALTNIIPSTTGAAKAVGKVIPALAGKLTGMSLRIPTVDVSVVDLTANLASPATYEEICAEMKRASENELRGIMLYTDEAVVSSDFLHNTHTSIFDAAAGIQLNETFVKLIAWYDNEWGYSNKVLDLVRHMHTTVNG